MDVRVYLLVAGVLAVYVGIRVVEHFLQETSRLTRGAWLASSPQGTWWLGSFVMSVLAIVGGSISREWWIVGIAGIVSLVCVWNLHRLKRGPPDPS